MKRAIEAVKRGELSFRGAAERYGVKFQTLHKKCKKLKEVPVEDLWGNDVKVKNGFDTRRIFDDAQEESLASYIVKLSQMGLGLTSQNISLLAFEMAERNQIPTPQSWADNQSAGKEWLLGFMKRHPQLSYRKPEACSIARASSFNRKNMSQFYDRLESVLSRHPNFQDGSRLFNLDECGTSTVTCLGKIVSLRGQRQVYMSTSGERGILVTTCLIVGALGQVLPPAMIFPRRQFKNNMLIGAYPGTLGLAAESGWMNSEIFVNVLQHFAKCTGSSKENPTLLLLDNCESHITLKAVEYAKEHGIVILTLVPHTTHRTQPLDVSVMGPFKRGYEAAMANWKRAHPNVNVTIYEIAQFVEAAISKTVTPGNIVAGFRKTGIMSFNRAVFSEEDFLPSKVTDRPDPEMIPPSNGESEGKNFIYLIYFIFVNLLIYFVFSFSCCWHLLVSVSK